MLEAYKNQNALESLNARLPEYAADVKPVLLKFLQENATNTYALLVLARAQTRCGEQKEARHSLETILANESAHVGARVELAKILHAENESQAAIELLKEATQIDPVIHENWQLLSEYFQEDNQPQASENARSQYNMIKLFNENLQLAEQAFAGGDYRLCDTICRRLLEKVPNEVRALRVMAKMARQLRYFEVSTSILTRCIETRPNDADLGLEYGWSLLSSTQHQAALAQCEKLIELAPEKIEVYDLKAEALYHLGRYQEAIDIYRELVEVDDNRSLRMLTLGKVLNTTGDVQQAIQSLQKAIAIEPSMGQAYWELANMKAHQFSDEETAAMQQLLQAEGIEATNKMLVQFALGKALEDQQQFAQSFENYQSANQAYRKSLPFQYSSQNKKFESCFTSGYFSEMKTAGSDSDAPVFVLGMPRSGSTLVEQILSSHSQVDATMEVTEMISIARELNGSDQPGKDLYPNCLQNMKSEQVQNLALRYLDYVKPLRQGAPHFIDKAPGNFHHIGLIRTLFPNARIIDIRRNPMASGWSLYKHFFADSFLFSYDLETIGHYYADYIELMDHWHTVMPDSILTIRYEDLVGDLSAGVNTLLSYCGLEFEQACLDFHKNKRAVSTPSSDQVRQPIYSDALEHWRNYEAYLAPLRQVIDARGLTE